MAESVCARASERASVCDEVLLAMCSTRFVLCAIVWEEQVSLCLSLIGSGNTTNWLVGICTRRWMCNTRRAGGRRVMISPQNSQHRVGSPFYIPFFKHDSLSRSARRWFLSHSLMRFPLSASLFLSLAHQPLGLICIYVYGWVFEHNYVCECAPPALKSNTSSCVWLAVCQPHPSDCGTCAKFQFACQSV